jgi:hypothetical protein
MRKRMNTERCKDDIYNVVRDRRKDRLHKKGL